jgi:hypothetical protein
MPLGRARGFIDALGAQGDFSPRFFFWGAKDSSDALVAPRGTWVDFFFWGRQGFAGSLGNQFSRRLVRVATRISGPQDFMPVVYANRTWIDVDELISCPVVAPAGNDAAIISAS